MNGERPLLLDSIKFHLQANAPFWIQFIPQTGGSIDLKLETHLLHGFCKLILDAEKKACWGLDLNLPGSEEMHVPAHMLN